jgi:ADP-ribosylglycohydrolase/fructose-1,6-bisphosphatase/inositol monophosphatase family enzyme
MNDLTPELLARVISCVARAGDMLAAEFRRLPRPRGQGHTADIDTEIERLLRAELLGLLRCRFIGEETGTVDDPDSHLCWVVDPHDGTSAFLEGHRGSAVSVALLQAAVPVLGVVYAPLSPDRGRDLIAWIAGLDHVLRNGERVRVDLGASALRSGDVVFLNHRASAAAVANGRFVHPARFVSLPSIAYRLARVAVGDGVAAVSTNGPGAVDYAAGHALVLGAGGLLLNESGQPVTYDESGHSSVGACFGGAPTAAWELAARLRRRGPEESRRPPRVTLGWPRRADEAVLDRAIGCLLGQVIGDSLGALVEFQRPGDIARRYPTGVRDLRDGGVWDTLAGQPTDDSELALALARTLVGRRAYDPEAAAEAYGRWYASGPFDVGTATRAAFRAAADAPSEKADAAAAAALRGAESNGSLMRVSPIGIWAGDAGVAAHAARRDSALSHPHPVCVAACAAYVAAIAAGIGGADRAGMLAVAARAAEADGATAPAVAAALDDARGGRRPDSYTRDMGRVLIAFQNAFYHLAHTASFETALVDTIARGGDTDTNAAIAGALLGAAVGRGPIPPRWTTVVLSCRPLTHLAARHPRPAEYWPDDIPALAEALIATRQETTA